MKVVIIVIAIGVAAGQYGPPSNAGQRRTTTTENYSNVNEIQPTVSEKAGTFPDGGSYQIKTSSINQPGIQVKSHSYSYNGPNNPASNSQQPMDILNNPFIANKLSGKPLPSNPGFMGSASNNVPSNFPAYPSQPQQPQVCFNQPQPGYQNPGQPPYTNQQNFPSQPPKPAIPGYPAQQPRPIPNQPGNQNPVQPPFNNQQPKPGYPVQQPQPIPNQPGNQNPVQPPYYNQQPKPGYPAQQPQSVPNQPGNQNSGQPPYTNQQVLPSQQPRPIPNQPGYQNPVQPPYNNLQPKPGYPVQQPQPIPNQPGNQNPGQPPYTNQQILPSQRPKPVNPADPSEQFLQQPQPGYPRPALPNQQQNPSQPAPVNPGNPFINGNTRPSCTGDHQFCVPQNACSNGLIIDKSSQPELIYAKGQCNAGQVCCKSQPRPNFGNQPLPTYVTQAPIQKYTGPLNTTPPPGCAAALKCVPESYCTVEGVMSDTPVALTREQTENKVPLTDCLNTDTGVIGKCCRDPNYKDPWPGGMMMMMNKNPGFDDGQYRPENYPGGSPPSVPQVIPNYNPTSSNPQVQPKPQNPYFPPQVTVNPSYTIKKPIGVFNTQVTPFPVAPKPGQTHSQVFPGNEDKNFGGNPLAQNVPQPGINTQGPAGSHPVPKPNAPYPQPQQTSPYNQNTPVPNTPFQPQPPLPPRFQTPSPQQEPTQRPTQPISTPRPGEECGVRRPATPTRPDETGFGEFPWHVAIQTAGNRSSVCSGAIIAPNAVLTAAQCIQGLKPEELIVRAGDWTLGQNGPRPVQTIVAAASAIHPVYSSGSLVKDQAVIVTEQPFSFDEHIDKICLPAPGLDTYSPSTTTCFLTGWGRPNLQDNSPGSVLHKVPVNIIPKEQCEKSLKSTHLGKYFILNEGFTCAAPPSEADLCKVDIGSPLICQRPDGHFELAGVYSWDTKCYSDIPGVMATCDTNWINQILATPLETLKQQAESPVTIILPDDALLKPGFALGYGK